VKTYVCCAVVVWSKEKRKKELSTATSFPPRSVLALLLISSSYLQDHTNSTYHTLRLIAVPVPRQEVTYFYFLLKIEYLK